MVEIIMLKNLSLLCYLIPVDVSVFVMNLSVCGRVCVCVISELSTYEAW